VDLDEMIHDLEVEQQRIQDAVDVLRRLQRIRKPSSARFEEKEEAPGEIGDSEPTEDYCEANGAHAR
jgi:hypothetical protein